MLASYHQDYTRSPDELCEALRKRKEDNSSSYCQLVGNISDAFYYDPTLAGFPQAKLNKFARDLVAMPKVERRLIMRLGLRQERAKTSAFPLIAAISYALEQTATVEECAGRFGALLEDDAADDLVGVVLMKWLDSGQSPVAMVRAILANQNAVIEVLKLLGYVLYGRLASEQDVEAKLRTIPEARNSALLGIREWCFGRGTEYLRSRFSAVPEASDEGWLNVAAFCKTVLERTDTLDVLAGMIVGLRDGVVGVEPRRNERNQRWLKASRIPEPIVCKWLGPMSWSEVVERVGKVSFSLAEDLRPCFQIGNFHGSCLRLVFGEYNWAIPGLITDVNKRILSCRSDSGDLIGRRTVAISYSGLHACPVYPLCHPTVSRLLERGTVRLEQELGLDRARSGGNLRARGITGWAYSADWHVGADTLPEQYPGVQPYEFEG